LALVRLASFSWTVAFWARSSMTKSGSPAFTWSPIVTGTSLTMPAMAVPMSMLRELDSTTPPPPM